MGVLFWLRLNLNFLAFNSLPFWFRKSFTGKLTSLKFGGHRGEIRGSKNIFDFDFTKFLVKVLNQAIVGVL